MNMKKLLFILPAFMIFAIQAEAQTTAKTTANPFYISLMGGPSLPVGVFGSTEGEKYQDAGFAQVGFNLKLNGGYSITENFGVASNFMYSRYQLNNKAVNDFLGSSGTDAVDADHWQYWGVVVGPVGTVSITDDLLLDIRALAGYASANAPQIKFGIEGVPDVQLSTADKWKDAFTWQVGTQLRYNFSKSAFVVGNLDYQYMKPKWKYDITSNGTGSDLIIEQRMGALNLNVGVGLTF
ncbi:MAG: hypothetical protein RL582_1017 [Bacteroidota bacterium]